MDILYNANDNDDDDDGHHRTQSCNDIYWYHCFLFLLLIILRGVDDFLCKPSIHCLLNDGFYRVPLPMAGCLLQLMQVLVLGHHLRIWYRNGKRLID